MKSIGALLGLLITTASFTQAEVYVSRSVGDTYVANTAPTVNYGDATKMNVYPVADTLFSSFVKFEMPSLAQGEVITKARVGLYIEGPFPDWSSQSLKLFARDPGVAWDENTLTWNNAPQPVLNIENWSGAPSDPAALTPVNLNAWVWFDITSLASGWASNPSVNYGVAVAGVNTGSPTFGTFRTSEYADPAYHPKLEVTTITPPTYVTRSVGDTYVANTAPTVNYGDATKMNVYPVADTLFSSFVKFEMPSLAQGEVITKARVGLYIEGPFPDWSSQSLKLFARDPGVAWDENTLTWNNAPQPVLNIENWSGAPSDPAALTPVNLNAWVWFDITSLASGWASNPSVNYGVAVAGVNTGSPTFGTFRTSEYADPAYHPKLEVTTITQPTYASWAADNAGGQTANLDWDNDGVTNGVEYFMNSAAGFTANPGLVGNTVTWSNGGNISASTYGTQFIVQTSSDLVTWDEVAEGDLNSNTNGPAGSLSYSVDPANGPAKQFVRLKVTSN